VTTSWYPTGKQLQPVEFLFDVRVAEEAWSVRLDDLSARAGKRASSDFTELSCDGRDLFRVVHCQDALRTNVAARLRFDRFGTVYEATFPAYATPLERILWLAFCSGKYPALSARNFPQVDDSLMHTNIAAVTVDYYSTEPHVPKNLRVWAKGLLLPNPESPQGTRLIRPEGELQDGYLALELETTLPTNAAGAAVVPKQLKALFYGLDLASHPPKRYRATEMIVSVESLGPLHEPIASPELIGSANVLDTRYTNKAGRPFHYMETNGTWASRADASPITALEAKTKAPIYKTMRASGKRHMARWLVVLTLCAPTGFYLSTLLRRKGQNTQTTNND
jgi:hypothetical protein